MSLKVESSAEIFNLLSGLPSRLDDVDLLLQTAENLCRDSVDNDLVESLRRSFPSSDISLTLRACTGSTFLQ